MNRTGRDETPRIWIMRVANGDWYPIEPSDRCKPEDHGRINPHVSQIEDMAGNVLWKRRPDA
jgi:hypothetical protein